MTHNDEQVVIYIDKPFRHFFRDFLEGRPKYHLYDCITITTQKNRQNFDERYVATTRVDGFFDLKLDGEIKEHKLRVCKHCLKKFDKNMKPKEFDLASFFRDHATFFKDLTNRRDVTSPVGKRDNYAGAWSQVSRTYREKQNWTCEQCHVMLKEHTRLVMLKEHTRLLHAHHKNRKTRDNSDGNLQALCALCHQKEHSHLYVSPEDQETILRLRTEQGKKV